MTPTSNFRGRSNIYAGVTPEESAAEWGRKLTGLTMSLLLFETRTGLAIFFLPFSTFNQYGVLLHSLLGMLMLAPVGWYLVRHWSRRFRGKFNHFQLLGYLSAAALLAACITGIILVWQALFSSAIGPVWSLIHLVATFLIIFALSAHLMMHWSAKKGGSDKAKRQGRKKFLALSLGGTLFLFMVQTGLTLAYKPNEVHNEFPADYSWKFGKERPFAPSLVRTASDHAYDPTTLSGSAGCGKSGCHAEILKEWEPSAHRYASSDVAFQAVQRLMLADEGPESTRYCAGCHDPIALFSGSKNVNVDGLTSPGADEGISCVICHSITNTDVRGNADYELTQPMRYLGEQGADDYDSTLGDFLIRSYPKKHKEMYSRPLYKTAEYCAACHKQFIDKEVNGIGWVQLQNQYDNWRKSRWYQEGNAQETVTCRECHMPLIDSQDPAAGDGGDYNREPNDGKHRSHRFLAANQVMPLLLDLPGAKEHVALTEKWLQGKIEVPEIADKWTSGPVIRLDLSAPSSVKPGGEVPLRVVLTNSKTGHGFPTGPLDIIRSWVEITVTDDAGNLVFETGKPDEKGMMDKDALVFKAEGIDRYGNDIDQHNLWEMVGARFKRSLFPGMSDTETYSFACPGFSKPAFKDMDKDQNDVTFAAPLGVNRLHVKATLNYQKADAVFLDKLFGEDAGIRSPITEISSDDLAIEVRHE